MTLRLWSVSLLMRYNICCRLLGGPAVCFLSPVCIHSPVGINKESVVLCPVFTAWLVFLDNSFPMPMQVESLTAGRKSAMSGSEPSDAIRVVNALLTQLDQVKRFPNVLILTTSNVTGAIDLAFVDRSALVSLPLSHS